MSMDGSSYKRRTGDTVWGKVLDSWQIIVAIIMLAVAWGTLQTKLTYMERDINKESQVNSYQSEIITKHDESLKLLPEMREDIKSLLREVRRDRHRD